MRVVLVHARLDHARHAEPSHPREGAEGRDAAAGDEELDRVAGLKQTPPGADATREDAREHSGADFPQHPREQLDQAIRAVFDSWDAPRAQVYRRTYEIPDDIGTAVNVVQMVYGNKGESSSTGVCFTSVRRASVNVSSYAVVGVTSDV